MKKHLKEHKRRVLVIGPYPPPIGGVATHIQHLMAQQRLNDRFSLELYRTGKTNEYTSNFVQFFLEVCKMFRYIAVLHSLEPDIVHIHTASKMSFYRNIPYVIFSRFLSGGKVLIHIHGAEFEDFFETGSPMVKRCIAYVLNKSDGIIVTSERWIRVVQNICNTSTTIFSIPNGYEESHFHSIDPDTAREQLGIPKNKKILLTVGCLEDYKGHKYLIESMKDVRTIRSDIAAYIIGVGSQQVSLEELIARYQLEQHVFLAGGNKPIEELNLWINACDCFVLPSLNEGNPTVMFEAMACGKPFVGTNVGGIPDIITSDHYGLLCDPGDSGALAEIIMESLDAHWNTGEILQYSNEFSWKNIAEKTEGAYRTCIDAS